jgi:uroporphyrinogen-III synthase
MTAPAAALAGRGIVVTRPAQQAGPLAARIRAAGGHPILFPVLEIVDTGDLQPLIDVIDRLDDYQLAVFISPNAVVRAMKQLGIRRSWPASLRVAAIGKGSVRELERSGVTGVIAPDRQFDSEHLLELPELQSVAGQRVVIFRGDGGRELLGDTLTARGARVDYVECYRRARPQADARPLLDAWDGNALHAVTITSSEGMRNLYAMVGESGRAQLRGTPVFAPHPRIAAVARELGCSHVIDTAPGDDGLMEALQGHFAV